MDGESGRGDCGGGGVKEATDGWEIIWGDKEGKTQRAGRGEDSLTGRAEMRRRRRSKRKGDFIHILFF